MGGQDAVGFLSYVHADNEADDERITKLARRLVSVYGLVTGRTLELFLDRDSIAWGDAWSERIDDAIVGTTFFFPVITPRYFASPECRRELLKFVAESRRRGVQELLLPIYYVSVDELDHSPTDEVMAIVAARQREDLRTARLEEEGSSLYRTTLDRLARSIASIADDLALSPRESSETSSRRSPPDSSVAAAPGNGDEGPPPTPESGDDLAQKLINTLTLKLQAAAAAMNDMTPALRAARDLASEAQAEIDAAGGSRPAYAEALSSYAQSLRDPARQIERSGQDYARLLIEANPDMLTLYALADSGQVPAVDIAALSRAIRGLFASSKVQGATGEDFLSALDRHIRLSRSLQEPVARLRSGMLGVKDAIGVIEEWDGLARKYAPEEEAGEDASPGKAS
jgi:TIR domain